MIRTSSVCFLLLIQALPGIPVFIGTNTGPNTVSKGIYFADFDEVTGKLTRPELAVEYQNPGFLAQHPTRPVLYACGQPTQPFGDKTGAVAAFAISDQYALSLIGETSSKGQGPCHVAVDGAGKTVAVANYGDGMVATIRLDENGKLGEAAWSLITPGSGPHSRQKGPHAHGVYFDRSGSHLLVPDLGLDKVLVFPFDPATSKAGDAKPALATAPGAGPRHMALSPDEKHAYVINELDNTILVAGYDGKGAFTFIETVPTLPPDFKGINTTAEVEVSADGTWVFGSNRGHNSIVVYRRDLQSGKLSYVEHQDCGGKTPRHFKLSPGGKWLLCAHQESNTISVLPLDPETGRLGAPLRTVPAPSPICILFAR